MAPKFRSDKTTEAAVLLLRLRGGRMSYMKLIKLLYIIDRNAIIKFGRPITFDTYVSMNRGPVLSNTLNLINEGELPGEKVYWSNCISKPEGYEVSLIAEPTYDSLSESEIELIQEIFTIYGHLNRWELVEMLHEYPEWNDPKGGAIPITYRDILKAVEKTDLEISEIEEEIEAIAIADTILDR